MREILFRGKSVIPQDILEELGMPHKNGWVYGSYADWFIIYEVIDARDEYTTSGQWCRVDPETVGQYTGLTDKHGQKIFEGDICHCVSRMDAGDMVVIFEKGEFRMVLCECYKNYITGAGYFAIRNFEKEIIGNIHDNPELLEVGE